MAKLAVIVVPRSSRTEITGVMGEYLKIRLAAPPVDGKANEELVKFLSKLFRIPKSNIIIKSGTSGKRKLLDIEGVEQSAIDALFGEYK
ncbi:MAG: YggU family protein [bacterium]|nr:YggU family protein [bacterium]